MNRLIFLACVGLAGCGQAHSAASDSLALPVSIRSGGVADSRVTFTIEGGYAQATQVTMTSAQSQLKLHTTATRAELDAFELPLGDVTISSEAMPPNGLVLRNVILSAAPTRADVLHAQDDLLELRALVPLTIDSSMQLADGSLYRLGAQHTAAVALDLHIVRSGARTIASVVAGCAGVCWEIDGVARLSDGAVHLVTDADVTAAP